MYQARILDKDRQLKAVLPGVRWHYNRRINEATEISIYIPRETIDEVITQDHELYGFFAPSQPFVVQAKPQRSRQNKAQYAEIASYIQIYKGSTLKASGKIVGRTLGQIVTVEAYSEEILLETNLTPAQYGKVWDGWDLADVARDLLDGWRSIRVKDQSQWQDRMVDSSNVDLTTNPGHVMLAKRASGQYYDSGYLTLVFNKSEIPNFKAWDRVRWSADSEEPVTTSIQVSTNGVSFSDVFDGGLPEEIGYYIGGDHDQVWVRINLETTDTESEDANEVPTGVTPTVFAVELIARTEGNLVAGNIPAAAGVTVKGLSADHASAFRALVDACEQVDWEFNVWNGALNVAEALGTDRTKDFVFRAGSNIEIQTLGDDDGEMVNILTAYGPGSGINRLEITLRDEASIAEFGEYPLAMQFDAETLAELQQKAQEFLDEHNSPKMQFEIAVDFDHEKEPDYGLGDRVRVADPETGIVTTTRIMAEAREYGENGLVVNLELGKANFTLSEAISGEKRVAKPLDPLQPTGVYARGIIAGVIVGCAVPKIDWDYTECHLSTASGFTPSSSTLRTKGRQTRFDIIDLTPGVRYYAKVVHIDNDGRRSEPSQEVSAVALDVVDAIPDGSLPDSKQEDYEIIPDKVVIKSPHMDSDANVVLFWYQVTNVKIATYEVLVGNDSYLTNSTNFPLTGLYVDAQLTAKVRAISHYGKIGPWSETVVVDMPKLLNKTVEATYLAKQRFQTLLDNHFYGDEDGYFDGKTIKPNTVETQAIAVGSPLRAFMLRGITIEPNADGEKKWRNTAGYLVQIEGDNYQINALTETQTSGVHYVYARVHKTVSNTADNRFLFETEKRTTHEDETYYYFAVGIYDTTGDVATWASSYGYTMIDGRQVTTGTINAENVNITTGDSGVVIDGGGVTTTDADGNYSLLSAARLQFYRKIGDEDVPSYYVAQIATGEAVDGQTIDLATLGYRFFERPKIVLQPKLNRVFVANTTSQDVWMDWDVLDQTFDQVTGVATFRVRCRTIIKGAQGSGTFSPSKLEQAGNFMLATTTPGTVYFAFRAQGYAHAQYIWQSAKLTFHVDYRLVGGSWVRLDTKSFSSAKSLEFDQRFTYNVPTSGALAYEVRIQLAELSDWIPSGETRVPHLTLSEFSYRSEDTILSEPNNPEVVSWIAIDGG